MEGYVVSRHIMGSFILEGGLRGPSWHRMLENKGKIDNLGGLHRSSTPRPEVRRYGFRARAMKEKAVAAYIVSSQDAEMIESLHTAIEKLEKRRGKWRVDGD
jgi:hypothetical protein